MALVAIGLVLGTVSLIGDPAALADNTDAATVGTASPEAAADDDAADASPTGGDAADDPSPAGDAGDGAGDDAGDDAADGAPAASDGAADDAGDDAADDAPAGDDGAAQEPSDALEDVAVGIDAEEPGDVLEEITAQIGAVDDSGGQATPPGAVAAEDGVVHLTFDDGPHPVYTPQVLDILARYDAKATFFVLGSLAEAHPELIDRIVAEGHTLANHSWAHQDLAQLSREQFDESIGRTEAVLGEHATACMRPPFGSMNENTRAWAADFGLEVILWDTDTVDWQKPGVDAIADSIVDGARNGRTNILLHDGGGDRTQSVQALDQALSELSGDGLRFEPICR